MRKISVLLIICMIVCALPLTSLADAVSVSDEGVVTYFNDFESSDASSYSKYGIATYKGKSAPYGTFSVTGDTTNKYFMATNTDKSVYPTFRVNFLKTDASPKINSIADAKKYKVNFKMKLSPTVQGALTLNCGGFWKFQFYSKTYAISCNNGAVTAVEGAKKDGYSVNLTTSGANPFREYEIDIDKTTNTCVFKVEGDKIFENVPLYSTNDFNSLLVGYSSLTGSVFIDDIKVTVTDKAECSDTNYASATNINFDNFGIGIIPNSADTKIGGFENDNEQTGYAYIDYTYKSENPSEANKFLKITKYAKEKKPFSIKRDISGVVGDYSVYDVSFKIKNGLGTASTESAFIRLADGSNLNNGAVVSISGKDGKIGWFDYSTGAGVSNISEKTAAAGEWTEIKARIYKDENKADLYVGDMENPIAQNIKTNRKTIGDYIVFAPQKSAVNSSISVDDIVITPVTESDYVLTYTTDSDDLAKYTSSGVSAQCKITKEGAQTPVIIIAEYGADGRLVNIAKSGSAQNGTISATLSGAGAQTGENVSVMLWQSLDNPVPLKKLIKLLPDVK